jgi:phosphoserine phosphatase
MEVLNDKIVNKNFLIFDLDRTLVDADEAIFWITKKQFKNLI